MNILVYGTLKKGFYNHCILEKSSLVKKGFFVIENKSLRSEENSSFPYLYDGFKTNYFYGEVYKVNYKTLKNLDTLEGHPDFYKRIIIKEINASVYVCSDEHVKDMTTINDFQFENLMKNNIKNDVLSYFSLNKNLKEFAFSTIKDIQKHFKSFAFDMTLFSDPNEIYDQLLITIKSSHKNRVELYDDFLNTWVEKVPKELIDKIVFNIEDINEE